MHIYYIRDFSYCRVVSYRIIVSMLRRVEANKNSFCVLISALQRKSYESNSIQMDINLKMNYMLMSGHTSHFFEGLFIHWFQPFIYNNEVQSHLQRNLHRLIRSCWQIRHWFPLTLAKFFFYFMLIDNMLKS